MPDNKKKKVNKERESQEKRRKSIWFRKIPLGGYNKELEQEKGT